MLDTGLVQTRQRYGLKFQAVHGEVVGGDLLHLLHEVCALFVQLVHGHARGDRAQRVDELALDQVLQHFGLHRALAQRLRGHGDGLAVGLHADVKLRLHVDAQPVERDQRFPIPTHHAQHQRVHVDGHGLVEDREHQRAPVHHDLFAADAGPHECDFLRGAAIHLQQEDDDDEDRDGPSQQCHEAEIQ